MGAVVSRWKAKPTTVELLEGIDKDIKDLEEFREKNQRLEKLWLEEVMETETYKNAKLILEKFDPEANKKVEMEFTPIRPGQMTPRPGQELRQRNIALRPPVMGAGTTPTGPLPHSAPGGPPGGPPDRGLSAAVAQQTIMRRPPMTPCTPVPGMGMHPPGPPLARPVLPRDRGAVDRVIEYLVGDGPQNRYALICQQCFSHNGMALKEEFEYIAFRCAYCYVLNHARKTRPQAPRLPEFSFERRMRSESPTPERSAASEATDESAPPSGDEKELEAPSDEVEPQVEKAQSTEETPDPNVENPEAAETVHTEEEPERPGEKQEVPQLETE
ncbi:endoplasmic reticulum junction formation protein lunapark-B isoform X8 [Salvelinus alpinus]|uniref:endoplasmic reticulum junction formation protein lunapark-B isoform X8 n=1 Tax=Salvelinus alpinus TaxID=8036 RepID=UPI0039FD0CEE